MINVNNVSFSYKDNKVVDDISLQINENEFIAIIGINGSRKNKLN